VYSSREGSVSLSLAYSKTGVLYQDNRLLPAVTVLLCPYPRFTDLTQCPHLAFQASVPKADLAPTGYVLVFFDEFPQNVHAFPAAVPQQVIVRRK
jgi:hypothetical protein